MPRSVGRSFRLAFWMVLAAHLAFFADYYRLTDGCFCAITGSGLPVHRTYPGEFQFLHIIALPITNLPISLPEWVGGLPGTVFLAIVNSLLWFLGVAVSVALWQRSRAVVRAYLTTI